MRRGDVERIARGMGAEIRGRVRARGGYFGALDVAAQVENNMTFQELVVEELGKARQGHGAMNSAHEGYAVLLEEVDELWDEVRKKRDERNHALMLKELVQIAAMAQRMAEDVVIPKIAALRA